MKLQESGNKENWLMAVWKELAGVECTLYPGMLKIRIKRCRVNIRTFGIYCAIIEVYCGGELAVETQLDSYKIKGGDRRPHNFIFCDDSLGISLFAEIMKEIDPTNARMVWDVFKETDRQYREKYRGMLAGNRFGF